MNLYNFIFCPRQAFSKKTSRVAFAATIFLLGVHGSTTASAQVRVTTPSAKGTLTFTPALQSMGNVVVGSSESLSVTITNTGTASLTISAESVTGAGISVSGLTIPSTLAVGASVKISVKFAPTAAGTVTGSLNITSNATNSVAQYPLSGTGVLPQVTVTPSSVSFGSVPAGTINSQAIQLKNTSSKSVTITGTTMSEVGNQYHTGGLTLPLTLAAGAVAQLQLYFKPTGNGAQSGTLTVNVASPGTSKVISFSGTGVGATRTISVTPSSLNFGSEALGISHQLTVSLKNTGNSTVTVSGIGVSNTSFTTGGGISGATLAAGQTATLGVIFNPKTAAAQSGTVNISSNASNSPAAITVTGTGVSGSTHSVMLSWGASSTSGIVGYYLYRSTTSGTGFARLVTSPLSGLQYTDGSVKSGATYYYVVTAVNASGVESPRTPQVTAAIP
jgi:Abnormal spindle-like microcephaly-assoc'd, ASPM-SPD-2-Hydin